MIMGGIESFGPPEGDPFLAQLENNKSATKTIKKLRGIEVIQTKISNLN